MVTQNVDNLHEKAGSSHIIHLHGELTKVCSSRDQFDERYVRELTAEHCEGMPGEKAGDGSLLRPFIVFFGESVPMIHRPRGSADRWHSQPHPHLQRSLRGDESIDFYPIKLFYLNRYYT